MSQADSRKVVKSILASMKEIFKNSTRGARERAWHKFCTERGKAEVRRLINNPSMPLNHFDDFLTFKEWLVQEAFSINEVPPEPGTVPLPPDCVRLYHYINLRGGQTQEQAINSVLTKGIDIGMARGSTYGEPNIVWASTEMPMRGKIYVEFFMHMNDPRWGIGKPRSPEDVDWLHKRGANVTFSASIRPDEIVTFHLPWHDTYRYLQSNNMFQRVLDGEFDHLLDRPDMPESQAVSYIKQKHQKAGI